MNYGPVPSKTYDILKAVRGDSFSQTDEFNKYFTVDNSYIVKALIDPDLDEFSESDIECLTESLNENGHLGFHELVRKSHGKAYEKTTKNSTIPIDEIAKEGGANNEMLKYINAIAENSNVFC